MPENDLIQLKTLPILQHATQEPSVFLPENLLAQAAAMKGGGRLGIPGCCILDFDGELVAVGREYFGARPSPDWPCFHTSLLVIEQEGFAMGRSAGRLVLPLRCWSLSS